MTSGSLRTKAVLGGLALALTSVSCADRLPTSSASPKSVGGGARMSSQHECTADVASRRLVCTPTRPSTALGISPALLGQGQVKLTSSNVVFDSTTLIFSFDVTLKNLLGEPIGTPDGITVAGSKVFYESGPTATSYYSPGDTGTVTVHNADGYANFTKAQQPFHFYEQILAPLAVSPAKNWQLHIPRSVATFSFVLLVFTYTASEPAVPSSAPDAWLIPEDSAALLFADENLIVDNPRMSGPYPRNLILLRFTPTATEDERKAAIDQAGGVVVGGNSAYYYVKVADGIEPVWTAVDRLKPLPQVEQVIPYVMGITTAYQRPDNGAGWQKADWQVHRDSARGVNWAPEAVNAPAAWGCETGNSDADVAVVDLTSEHGGWVSSIIRNPGDTKSGMVGMMWGGDMTMYNASSEPGADQNTKITSALRKAIVIQKAKVINISLARGYFTNLPGGTRVQRLPNPASGADSAAATASANFLRTVIATHEAAAAHQPLYIIAAGNLQMDAFFSGYAQLASGPLSSRVIVVAGHTDARAGTTRPLWANSGHAIERGSNTGSLPSIAAPASPVNVIGTANDTIQGTSFAAPHVAGIAGLLFSQVGTRDANTVRSYIMEGATRGGRTAGGYPIANAYESLKRGAEDQGAPLCGNRVWADGAQIYAQRGSGAPEALGPAETNGDVGDLLTQHGGRVILYNNTAGQGKALHRQTDGTWALGAIPADYNVKIGGATWSVRAYSHGADSLVQLNTSVVNNNVWWRTGNQTGVPVILRTVQNPNGSQLGTLPITDLPQPETRMCVERVPNGMCTYTTISGRSWLFRVAYPQAYQPVLITVSPVDIAFVDSTAWRTCTHDPSLQCRNVRSGLQWSATKVYKMPLTGGTPALVDTLPGTVLWIGQTEVAGSDTLVMGRGTWIIQTWFDPDTGNQPTTSELTSCAIEYRSLSTLATMGQQVANQKTCGLSSFTTPDNHGSGSFSPNRAPSRPNPGTPRIPREKRIELSDLLRPEGTRLH